VDGFLCGVTALGCQKTTGVGAWDKRAPGFACQGQVAEVSEFLRQPIANSHLPAALRETPLDDLIDVIAPHEASVLS
jgi:hypothetical protein